MNDTTVTDQVDMESTTICPAFPADALNASPTDNKSQYMYNMTGVGGGAEPMSGLVKGIVTLLYAAVIVLAVGGNLTVCCIVATQRRMHTVTNLFIASLAGSDVIMASLCIPLTFVADVIVQYWPFPEFLCPVALYAQVTQ